MIILHFWCLGWTTLFAGLMIFSSTCDSAPLQETTDLDLYEAECYYNYNYYAEGDRIITNEPCLNCTCHNKMLMCYLRVCPFTKPIGQDCIIEKREEQCCPTIICPDVPVQLLENQSSQTETSLGLTQRSGCNIQGRFYSEGSQIPADPLSPCELCYCIKNKTSCIMQECTLHVDGCTPIYNQGSCCPVRYNCDNVDNNVMEISDETTTVRPTPGFILTTISVNDKNECFHDKKSYPDGALIPGSTSCEHCYCMRGDIVCAVQECSVPLNKEGHNCKSLPPKENQCCSSHYFCEDFDKTSTDPLRPDETLVTRESDGDLIIDQFIPSTAIPISAESLNQNLRAQVSKEDVQLQEHINKAASVHVLSAESTTVLDFEFGTEATSARSDENNVGENFDENFNDNTNMLSNEDQTMTPLSLVTLSSGNTFTLSQSIHENEPSVSLDAVIEQLTKDITTDHDILTENHATVDSVNVSTEEQIKITENNVLNTSENNLETLSFVNSAVIPISVPGEGNCLEGNSTYANNTFVPSSKICDIDCKCISSVIKCNRIQCEIPDNKSCTVVKSETIECCPKYICNEVTSTEGNNQQRVENETFEQELEQETFSSTKEGVITENQKTESSIIDETVKVSDVLQQSSTPSQHQIRLVNNDTEYEGTTIVPVFDSSTVLQSKKSELEKKPRIPVQDEIETEVQKISTVTPEDMDEEFTSEKVNQDDSQTIFYDSLNMPTEENFVHHTGSDFENDSQTTQNEKFDEIENNEESSKATINEVVTSILPQSEKAQPLDDANLIEDGEIDVKTTKSPYADNGFSSGDLMSEKSSTFSTIVFEDADNNILSTPKTLEDIVTESIEESTISFGSNIFHTSTQALADDSSPEFTKQTQPQSLYEILSSTSPNKLIDLTTEYNKENSEVEKTTINSVEELKTSTEKNFEGTDFEMTTKTLDESFDENENVDQKTTENSNLNESQDEVISLTEKHILADDYTTAANIEDFKTENKLEVLLTASTQKSNDDKELNEVSLHESNFDENVAQTTVFSEINTELNQETIKDITETSETLVSTTDKVALQTSTQNSIPFTDEVQITTQTDIIYPLKDVTSQENENVEKNEQSTEFATIMPVTKYDLLNETVTQSEEETLPEEIISSHDVTEGTLLEATTSFDEKHDTGDESFSELENYTPDNILDPSNELLTTLSSLSGEKTSIYSVNSIDDKSTEDPIQENAEELDNNANNDSNYVIEKDKDDKKLVDISLNTVETMNSITEGHEIMFTPEISNEDDSIEITNLTEKITEDPHLVEIPSAEENEDSAQEIVTEEKSEATTEVSNMTPIIEKTEPISEDSTTIRIVYTTPSDILSSHQYSTQKFDHPHNLEHSTEKVELSIEKLDTSTQTLENSTHELASSNQPTSTLASFSSSHETKIPSTSTTQKIIPSMDSLYTEKPYHTTSTTTKFPQHHSHGHMPGNYPSYLEEDYSEEEDTNSFGPGTCRYGGKLFVSAQQIPRDDPCDFCFCFRSDIICLQQSCPPPITGCHEETIQGFCCPRYECPVSPATNFNLTTSTTTTLSPNVLHHNYKSIEKSGCQTQGRNYKVGDIIESASGPCMLCTCGGDGQMKCEPRMCAPEPMLRQMIAVVTSRRR